jgi:8-oxo-dGTP pyrophosphatase MutT (NUDIX family)
MNVIFYKDGGLPVAKLFKKRMRANEFALMEDGLPDFFLKDRKGLSENCKLRHKSEVFMITRMQFKSWHGDNETSLEMAVQNITSFHHEEQPIGTLRAAAVAIVITEHGGELAILLTRRSGKLRAHRGQWALPGGRMDSGESAEDAALRELEEEISLSLPRDAIIGRLDDYITRSGYRITPVVFWSGENSDQLKPNPDEVASIHTVSLKELASPSAPQFDAIPGIDRPVLSMKLSVDQIYAPTAAFLYQFREVGILGKHVRVLHYDQPSFAWK